MSRETEVFRYNLGIRIDHAINIIGKKADAAAHSGVSVEQINKWVKGTVKVPVEALRTLAQAANVDFSWLATGSGHPPHPRPLQIRIPTDLAESQVIEGAGEHPSYNLMHLPLFDIHASAGVGLPVSEELRLGAIAFDRQFLREKGASPEHCNIIRVRGDSMSPTIPDGSLLIVDHSQTEILNGYISVIAIDDELLVKRIRRRLDGMIDLISDNPAYQPESIAKDRLSQLRVIGRVVYFCRTP